MESCTRASSQSLLHSFYRLHFHTIFLSKVLQILVYFYVYVSCALKNEHSSEINKRFNSQLISPELQLPYFWNMYKYRFVSSFLASLFSPNKCPSLNRQLTVTMAFVREMKNKKLHRFSYSRKYGKFCSILLEQFIKPKPFFFYGGWVKIYAHIFNKLPLIMQWCNKLHLITKVCTSAK